MDRTLLLVDGVTARGCDLLGGGAAKGWVFCTSEGPPYPGGELRLTILGKGPSPHLWEGNPWNPQVGGRECWGRKQTGEPLGTGAPWDRSPQHGRDLVQGSRARLPDPLSDPSSAAPLLCTQPGEWVQGACGGNAGGAQEAGRPRETVEDTVAAGHKGLERGKYWGPWSCWVHGPWLCRGRGMETQRALTRKTSSTLPMAWRSEKPRWSPTPANSIPKSGIPTRA